VKTTYKTRLFLIKKMPGGGDKLIRLLIRGKKKTLKRNIKRLIFFEEFL
jgi:hypothetical protein